MKALSDTLQAMKLPEDSGREPPHGLTTTDGRSIIGNQIEVRRQPLTESQLTQIASKLLAKPPSISSGKRPVYGRKKISDEFGEYYVEDQPIGEEEAFEVGLVIPANVSEMVIESALRKSPVEATISHLMRLSVHKRLGTSEQDRAILIRDYAESLANIPEFVLHLACKHFRENGESHFFPTIKELKDICREIESAIKASRHKPAVQIEKKTEPEEPWTPPTDDDKEAVSNMLNEFFKQS